MLEFAPGAETAHVCRPRNDLDSAVFFTAPLVAASSRIGLASPWVFSTASIDDLVGLGIFIAYLHDPEEEQEVVTEKRNHDRHRS